MFRLLISMIILGTILISSSLAFAEVGPLTAKYQDFLKVNGCYFMKYNDYTQTDMLEFYGYKKKKRKPSSVVSVAQCGGNRYRESIGANLSKSAGTSIDLEIGDKHYKLDLKRRNGVVYKALGKDKTFIMSNNMGMFLADQMSPPTALTILIPDELKTNIMRQDAEMCQYYGSNEEEVDGIIYRCETYHIITQQMKRIYKLYFKDGIIAKYAHGDRIGEVLNVTNTVDNSLFMIPKGFIIYADNTNSLENPNRGIDDLLKNKNGLQVVERY